MKQLTPTSTGYIPALCRLTTSYEHYRYVELPTKLASLANGKYSHKNVIMYIDTKEKRKTERIKNANLNKRN